MKFITSAYTMDELRNLKECSDVVLLMVKGLSLNHKDLDPDEAVSYCRMNHLEASLALDRIYTPSDIKTAEDALVKYKDLVDSFYVTDLGVANLAMKMGMKDKIILDPKTMVCNSMDLSIYASYGFKAIGVSSEITLKDVVSMKEKTSARIFYQGFGYRLMFYSRRHLLSLYGTKNSMDYPKEDIWLQESTRKDYFPAFENENGTCMYRSYVLCFMDYLEELKDVSYLYFESFRIPKDTMMGVLQLYRGVLDKTITKEEAARMWSSFRLNAEEGFIKKDSVYQKEELKS